MFTKFLHRPALAIVISLFILFMGGLSINLLPISQFPTVAPPSVRVSVSYPGASAKILIDSTMVILEQAINGVPNMSILDGWWVEGYNGANGWAIGNNALLDNTEAQDEADANSIYQLLEDEVIPLYYDRDRDDTPRGWVDIMRESIRSVAPQFGMRRMLKEYTEQLYIPALTEE